MSIDEKFLIYDDLKKYKLGLGQQQSEYDSQIANIDDYINNEATKKAVLKTNFANYCASAKTQLEKVQTDHAGKFTAEEAEVTQLIKDFTDKIEELK